MRIGPRFASILTALNLVACGSFAPSPKGFATLERKAGSMEAVSAEGVVYRIQRMRSDEAITPELWIEHVGAQLQAGGAFTMDRGELRLREGKGAFIEWYDPQDSDAQRYWVAVLKEGESTVMVQARGDESAFEGKRQEIVEAAESLQF